MADPRNVYYPSGKPLCVYEKNSQIVYSADMTEKCVRSMTPEGYFTGEMIHVDIKNGHPIPKMHKKLLEGSITEGKTDFFNAEGKITKTTFFEIDKNSANEFVYAEATKTNIVRLNKLDKKNNGVLKSIDFYLSGNIKRSVPCSNDLPHGKVIHYCDDADSTIENIKEMRNGIVVKSTDYDADMNWIDEIVYKDPSLGQATHIKKEGNKLTFLTFDNDKLVLMQRSTDGSMTDETSYNDLGQPEIIKSFTMLNKEQIGTTHILKASKWNRKKSILEGNLKTKNEFDFLVSSVDGLVLGKDHLPYGLGLFKQGFGQTAKGYLVNMKDGKEIDKRVPCHMMVENGELCAYSDGYSNPKTRKVLDPDFS